MFESGKDFTKQKQIKNAGIHCATIFLYYLNIWPTFGRRNTFKLIEWFIKGKSGMRAAVYSKPNLKQH